ncbi:MAG: glycoside hydrolase family 31 protein [Eubacteriales bacterium]|nr:glycoside hydrolase family 31 protein [Eubacteriales bacterium]
MNCFNRYQGGLEYRCGGETVRILPWGKDSFRVLARPCGKLETESEGLLEAKSMECEVVLEEECASVTNGRLTCRLEPQGWNVPARIRFFNEKGEELLSEQPCGGALAKKARHFRPAVGGSYQLRVTFASNPEEKLYGMGQYQQEILDLKGCNLELAHRNSQVSIPFYLSSLGYGFLWNNPAVGEVSFGKNTTVWKAESTSQMDYWITAGDSPAELMEAYMNAVGKPPMLPEAGLGFWQCKLRYYSQEDALSTAREYWRRGIPVDVFVIDYYHWPRCGDYRFDEEFFPNPREMVEELEAMGMKTMVSIWPQVDWRSENFQEMYQKGMLVQTEHGMNVQMNFHGNNVFYDATNPEARQYVWEKCKKNYADCGVAYYWLDEAEPEFGTYDYDNYRYYAGTVLEKGNIYPREYARGFYEGQKRLGQNEIMNLARCAWVGSQRYGTVVWSGDIFSSWQALRNQICAGLQMGLSGISWWTTDIGGFHGGSAEDPAFTELLIRWFQFGTFCPIMRLHGNRLPRREIRKADGELTEGTGADNEIWSYGEEAYRIMKHYIDIREAMRSYIRMLMEQAHKTGAPVMRTLFYDFPQDPTCWTVKDSYLFGSDLLVAPVTKPGAESREVYLPAGARWVHASSGAAYDGGQSVTVSAPLAQIPVFLREGRQEYLLKLLRDQTEWE